MTRENKGGLRVLHVYKDYYPPVKGGIEGHMNLLARGLQARGVEVRVLVANNCFALQRETIEGVPVTLVPQLGRLASAPITLAFTRWIRELGAKSDILHFHFPNPTAEASYLFSGLEGKVVVTYHSDIVRQRFLKKFYHPLLMRFLGAADAIIATSPRYVESSPILSGFRDKCVVIPLGIDLTRFRLNLERTRKVSGIRARAGERLILFIGRFRYYKGLQVLLKAMEAIDGKLLLIGAGPLEGALRQQVKESGLEGKVVFLGELSDEEVVLHLHACDLFVLPSIQRSEAFGIVQLEAMACGKPVVCTELGTGTSFVNEHGKTGLVVPPSDAALLASSINELLSGREMREAMGDAGRKRVEEHFTRETMVEKTLDLYTSVVAGERL
jgi:glycosyltransferase involved in cell wall biosynthesis